MFYRSLQEKFLMVATQNNLLDEDIAIQTKILKTAEAIGNPDRRDYPLLKGKEFLMEATFRGAKGQAYTDAPSEFAGALKDMIHLPLETTRQRALFVATLNAVMHYLEPDLGAVHCKDNEPEECAGEIAEFVTRSAPACIGLIGLQPAILECLATNFGARNVVCLDRDEEFRGQVKYGVPITWGSQQALVEMFAKASLVLATGSTIVNGSLVEIAHLAERSEVPVYFYGTSIAGAARLMELNRLCYRPA